MLDLVAYMVSPLDFLPNQLYCTWMKKSFIQFQPKCLFSYFSSLTALLGLPGQCWIELMRVDSFPLLSILGENYSFIQFYNMLALSFHRWSFQVEHALFCSYFAKGFYHKYMLDFIKLFFLHIKIITWYFFLVINMVNYTNLKINHPCIPVINSTLTILPYVALYFYILLHRICNFVKDSS